jgi:hypothetical protein
MKDMEHDPSSDPLQSLALALERSTMHGEPISGSEKVISSLMRQTNTILAVSKEPIISSDAVEIAFTNSLAQLKDRLSPRSQNSLLEYLIDYMPHDLADVKPNDMYFRGTLATFGVQALFDHVTRHNAASDYGQLKLDI